MHISDPAAASGADAQARIEALQALLAQREQELARAQHDLRDMYVRVDELAARRAGALAHERDEAVAASRAKSAFLANMSHEIRTPLTSIIGFGELLIEPLGDAVDRHEALRTVVRNGRHLLDIINDILDMSKIEMRQLEIESIDLPLLDLLADLRALVAGRAHEKGLAFEVRHRLPLPARLRTDPVRLRQILLNFCSNAVKFTRTGTVTLETACAPDGDRIEFTVRDTGIGMAPEQIERLFLPFTQADMSTTRRYGGSGLGLYISQQLAALLGGEIVVASRPGEGSRFTLRLPVGLPVAERGEITSEHALHAVVPADAPAAPVPHLSGRVLLAEDGVDNQRLLSLYLRMAGLQVDVAADGQAAVEAALARDYDLVLMDIQMPVMDGAAAAQLLRRAGYVGSILALTANVLQSDVQRYRECGCDDVLAKPVERQRFYAMISRHLRPRDDVRIDKDDEFQRELAELTDEFRAGLPAKIEAIAAASERGDWVRLQSLVHALKGTAGAFGFPQLTESAARINDALRANDTARAAALCPPLIALAASALATEKT